MGRQLECPAHRNAEREDDEAAGNAWPQPLRSDQQRERACTDDERRTTRIPEIRDQMKELAERISFTAADPEELRQLLHRDEDREPEHEPFHHRTRQRNCATNPSRKSPASKNSPPQKSTSAAPSA